MKRVSKGLFTDFQNELDNMAVFYDELGFFVGGLKEIVDSLNGMMYGVGAGVVESLGVSLAKQAKREFKLLLKYRNHLKISQESEAPAADQPTGDPEPPTSALAVVPDPDVPAAAGNQTPDITGAVASA